MIFAGDKLAVLKGGEVVGPHLGLLDQFLIGYSVTFVGSLIGAAYAFVIGYIFGLFIAWVYNLVVSSAIKYSPIMYKSIVITIKDRLSQAALFYYANTFPQCGSELMPAAGAISAALADLPASCCKH